LKPVNDLDDGIVLFFEPKSESSKNAAKLSFGRMAQRTDDLDIPVSKDCWDNQRKAIDDFREDKYNALEELKKSTIPTLLYNGRSRYWFSYGRLVSLNRRPRVNPGNCAASGSPCPSTSVP
jgi:hypothetical protein